MLLEHAFFAMMNINLMRILRNIVPIFVERRTIFVWLMRNGPLNQNLRQEVGKILMQRPIGFSESKLGILKTWFSGVRYQQITFSRQYRESLLAFFTMEPQLKQDIIDEANATLQRLDRSFGDGSLEGVKNIGDCLCASICAFMFKYITPDGYESFIEVLAEGMRKNIEADLEK